MRYTIRLPGLHIQIAGKGRIGISVAVMIVRIGSRPDIGVVIIVFPQRKQLDYAETVQRRIHIGESHRSRLLIIVSRISLMHFRIDTAYAALDHIVGNGRISLFRILFVRIYLVQRLDRRIIFADERFQLRKQTRIITAAVKGRFQSVHFGRHSFVIDSVFFVAGAGGEAGSQSIDALQVFPLRFA